MEAEIISQPYSGKYEERIYDPQTSFKSQNWTWIKFIEDDSKEWCGEFRGAPLALAISETYNTIMVLTAVLFHIDRYSGNLIAFEEQTQYKNLTASPLGRIYCF